MRRPDTSETATGGAAVKASNINAFRFTHIELSLDPASRFILQEAAAIQFKVRVRSAAMPRSPARRSRPVCAEIVFRKPHPC